MELVALGKRTIRHEMKVSGKFSPRINSEVLDKVELVKCKSIEPREFLTILPFSQDEQ